MWLPFFFFPVLDPNIPPIFVSDVDENATERTGALFKASDKQHLTQQNLGWV